MLHARVSGDYALIDISVNKVNDEETESGVQGRDLMLPKKHENKPDI
jgi:hypothetical protein